jgi:hypothetical protein
MRTKRESTARFPGIKAGSFFAQNNASSRISSIKQYKPSYHNNQLSVKKKMKFTASSLLFLLAATVVASPAPIPEAEEEENPRVAQIQSKNSLNNEVAGAACGDWGYFHCILFRRSFADSCSWGWCPNNSGCCPLDWGCCSASQGGGCCPPGQSSL